MTSPGSETVIANARIVLADRVIERGWIAVADGRVAEFRRGQGAAGSEDAGGDLIMPGLIELHTDHSRRTTCRAQKCSGIRSPRRLL